MSNKQAKAGVDAHIAAVLRRVRTIVQTRRQTNVHVTVVRSVRPGPNLLGHMSMGFLAAEATRSWMEHTAATAASVDLVAAEMRRRGFEEAATAVTDGTATDVKVPEIDDIFESDLSTDTKLKVAAAAVDSVAADIDEYDRRALSNAEVLDDLRAVNAAPEAIDAYAAALGASDISPSDTMAAEISDGGGVDLERTPAVAAPERPNEMTL